MIILLDTTVLIDVLRDRKNRKALLVELIEAGDTLATAAVNIGEVYSGMRADEEAVTESFLSNLQCFPLTAEIARSAGKLKSEWARKGRTLALADMIVAATALRHGTVLMTDNLKDFRLVHGLEMYPLS